MEKTSKDMLVQIALELDLKDILNFCNSFKKVNEKICKDDMFWRNKIEKEHPNIFSYNYLPKYISYRDFYENIQDTKYRRYSIDWTEDPLSIDFVIAGNIKQFDEIQNFTNSEPKTGDKVWIGISSDVDIYPPSMFSTKEDVIDSIKDSSQFNDIEYYYRGITLY